MYLADIGEKTRSVTAQGFRLFCFSSKHKHAYIHVYVYYSNDFDLGTIWVMQNLQEWNGCVARGAHVLHNVLYELQCYHLILLCLAN
jgi:hypothetical protein